MAASEKDLDSEDVAVSTKKNIKNATDLQRLKLEKLLKQPEKPVFIPDRPKERKMPKPPEFIRNAWGSSAGAGSGDFHVYRGVRRREYARQKFLDEVTDKKTKDDQFHEKVGKNLTAAEERTAKKRAKRLKKKQQQKAKRKKNTKQPGSSSSSESEDSAKEEEREQTDKRKEKTDQTDKQEDET